MPRRRLREVPPRRRRRPPRAGTRTELPRCPDMPDPSHLVIARVHGVAARSAELRGAAEELADSSAAQEGCVSFEVLAPRGAGAELVLLSAWQNVHAMRAHFASGAYGTYVSAVTELLTRPSDVTIYAVSDTVHPIPDLSTEPQRASRAAVATAGSARRWSRRARGGVGIPAGIAKRAGADRTAPCSTMAISQQSRCTTSPPDRIPHLLLLDDRRRKDEAGDRGSCGLVLSAHPGAATCIPRARSPNQLGGLPN